MVVLQSSTGDITISIQQRSIAETGDNLSSIRKALKSLRRRPIEKQSVRYVAISHVWSDGMGNTKQNSLPKCQLLRLQGLVNDLYEANEMPMPFWIDTVCVPHERGLRSLAIQKMRQTYFGADKVLVLDESFSKLPMDCCSAEEALVRIRFSKWGTRLWTLQEGIFAQELYFQFQDKAVQGETLIERYMRERLINRSPLLTPQVAEFEALYNNFHDAGAKKILRAFAFADKKLAKKLKLKNFGTEDRILLEKIHYGLDFLFVSSFSFIEEFLPRLSVINVGSKKTLREIGYALSQRTTSRQEDDTICVASLLDHGQEAHSKLLEINPQDWQQRMIYLLDMIEDIPPEVIFMKGARLTQKGYRWAPTTYLSTGNHSFGDKSRMSSTSARIHPQGLGLLLSASGISISQKSNRFPANESIVVRLMRDEDDGHQLYEVLLRNGFKSATWDSVDQTHQLAMVLRDYLGNGYVEGILVSLRQVLDVVGSRDTIFSSIRGNVVIGPCSGTQAGDTLHPITGKLLFANQKWCID